MTSIITEAELERLPDGVPSRDNSGRRCPEPEDPDRELPEHLRACSCGLHDGVCLECNYHVTIGREGVEYGHARSTNRPPSLGEDRVDCPHRPSATNTDPLA